MAKIRQLDGRDEVIEWVTVILRQAGRPSFEPPQGGRIAATALLAVADDVIE
jgi:hypothetical protein